MLLGVLCLLLSTGLQALGLGDLVVHSRPGEPLRASIPLTLEREERLAQVHVTLAPAEVYAQQGLERPAFLDGLRIGLLARGEGSARIELFGELPWQGQEALFLLQARWLQGEVTQRFRLAAVAPAPAGTQTPLFVEVAENETLDAIAMRLSVGRNRSYLHMMYALWQANPDAFYRGNMNNLKVGARLRVPTEEELYRLSDAEVFSAIRSQYAQWQQQQREHSAVATTDAGAMLSDVSEEQAEALDLADSPEVLQQRMQSLAKENEAIGRRNRELRERLARLERQMEQMTEQVLAYPTPAAPDALGPQAPAAPATSGDSGGKTGGAGQPVAILFILIVLVLGAVALAWRYGAVRRDGLK